MVAHGSQSAPKLAKCICVGLGFVCVAHTRNGIALLTDTIDCHSLVHYILSAFVGLVPLATATTPIYTVRRVNGTRVVCFVAGLDLCMDDAKFYSNFN